MYSYILMREGQARSCQTRQRFTYPLQLPFINFLSHPCILVISFRCRWPQGSAIGLEVEPSFMSMNAQVRPTSSLRPSALPYVNEFIKLLDLPLSHFNHLFEADKWALEASVLGAAIKIPLVGWAGNEH